MTDQLQLTRQEAEALLAVTDGWFSCPVMGAAVKKLKVIAGACRASVFRVVDMGQRLHLAGVNDTTLCGKPFNPRDAYQRGGAAHWKTQPDRHCKKCVGQR
jgi:hypothetical protein